MKSYEVHRIKKNFTRNSSEELAKETEDYINQKVAQGYELVEVSFHVPTGGSTYLYSFIVLKI